MAQAGSKIARWKMALFQITRAFCAAPTSQTAGIAHFARSQPDGDGHVSHSASTRERGRAGQSEAVDFGQRGRHVQASIAASGVVHDDVTGEFGVLGKEQQRRNPASAVRRAV